MDYKIGDIVALKSGGPAMTIRGIGVYGMGGTEVSVLCVWFVGTKKFEEVFHPDTIERVAPS